MDFNPTSHSFSSKENQKLIYVTSKSALVEWRKHGSASNKINFFSTEYKKLQPVTILDVTNETVYWAQRNSNHGFTMLPDIHPSPNSSSCSLKTHKTQHKMKWNADLLWVAECCWSGTLWHRTHYVGVHVCLHCQATATSLTNGIHHLSCAQWQQHLQSTHTQAKPFLRGNACTCYICDKLLSSSSVPKRTTQQSYQKYPLTW